MSLTRIHVARIANDIAHDLASGAFPGAVIAAWLIRRSAAATGSPDAVRAASAALGGASGALWLVLFLGLTVSVATGLLRLRYWKLNVRTGFLETKSETAAVKHSAFVLLLLASAAALYRIVGR